MADIPERIGSALAACGLGRGPLLVAVSGGADSVALLRAAAVLRETAGLSLCAGHLDHRLRAGSADDAHWLKELCARLDVPLVVGSEDVAARAAADGLGIEEAARRARYDFLERTARQQGCRFVAVAHTADDQAETVLHHVIRGTGLAGLRGMPVARPLGEGVTLVRPMLEVGRSDVEAWLTELGQDRRRDETNFELSHTRNRIRHALLPLLELDYNPQVREALRRLAAQAADAQDALEQTARRLLDESLVERRPQSCTLDCRPLHDQPRHLVRECFALLWKELDWPRQRMGYREWDQLAELSRSGGAVTLPAGIEARGRRGQLTLHRHV